MRTLIDKALIGTFIIASCWFIHSLYGWIGVVIFFGLIIGLPFLFLPLSILLAIIYLKIAAYKASKDFRTEI